MVIFYDEDCILCKRFKQALQLIDSKKQINFRSIYDENVYLEYPQLTFEQCEQEIHMLSEGKVFKGGEVIQELLKVIPGVKKFAWLIEKDSSKSALDAFYGQINDMRGMQKKKCFRCGSKRKRHYHEGEL
ncbi:MAG: hypothetical protein CME65_04650 [Halobacteriovoraceae bacterium]|nr:hypothetical protein [Halobacteriovoraceae bacterium]|tara:strand:+ start:1746 stop:2135 length:390 start_codon:yes stop_codon:yes gene_type:complete